MTHRIFIGSSQEQRELAKRIARELSEAGYLPLRWWNEFPLGTVTIDRLLEIGRCVDGAVFIFGDDDKVWYRGVESDAPRDNVLLEYGIFVSNLDRERCVIVRVGQSKMPNDLAGITFQPHSNGDMDAVAENIDSHFRRKFLEGHPPDQRSLRIVVDPAVIRDQLSDVPPADWAQRTLYMGISCARRWLNVTRSMSGAVEAHQRWVDQKVVDVASQVGASARTLVSFGPGDATLDRDILASFRRVNRGIQYIPVDICHGLLVHAMRALGGTVFVPIGIQGDFEDGFGFIETNILSFAQSPTLFALLGNTLGNLDRYEQAFLDSIQRLMRPEDWLVLEVFILGPQWTWEADKHTEPEGYNEALRRFIASSFVRYSSDAIENDVVQNFGRWIEFEQHGTDVPGARAVKIACAETGRRILTITKYDYDELVAWLKGRGWDVVAAERIIEGDEIRGTGIILMKARST